MSSEEIIRRLIKDMEAVKAEQKRLAAQRGLFQIKNINPTAISLAANQNNYDFGNYEFVVFAPTAARTITGFANGTNGGVLYIRNRNSGAFSITLSHNSASSNVGNRIFTQTGADFTLVHRNSALFLYGPDAVIGASGWILIFYTV